MNIIENKQFEEERALYGIVDTKVKNCVFAGEADGESVLKEAKSIYVEGCNFSLRYPLWHVKKFTLDNSNLDEKTRAPIWYAENGHIKNTDIESVKALRECRDMTVENSNIISPEFGWKCHGVNVSSSNIESEYIFLDSSSVKLSSVNFKGKYSFQYINDLVIEDSFLDTKDAFWHSKNVTVRNSTVKGEYLAWFSENLTLENCTIIGTQPFCYCENLKLINCKMQNCDLAFEYSSVEADVVGHIDSVKNVKSGHVYADSVGEIIHDGAVMECLGEVIIK